MSPPPPGLNDIDAQIAALEAKLGGAVASGSSDEDADDAATRRRRERKRSEKKARKREKKEKKRRREEKESDDDDDDDDAVAAAAESDSELERIAPLPSHLLPEHNAYSGKGIGRKKKRGEKNAANAGTTTAATTTTATRAGGDAGASGAAPAAAPTPALAAMIARREDMPRCDVCDKRFTSVAQLDEHERGKAHLKAARARATGGTPRDVSRRPPGAGRPAAPGKPIAGLPGPPAGAVEHCALCRKTFTSKAQLLEHEGGKWHALRVRGELPPSRRPYNA